MEFWGAEVKAGMPLKVRPQVDHLIHISQATIDGAKEGECGLLYVTVDWTKHVIGTLSQDHIPQISFDLVFEQEFELSHSLEQGSVHFLGYKSPNIDQEEYYPSDSEVVPATSTVTSHGNTGAAASNVVKADESKPKAKPAEVKPESDDDESDEEEDDSEDDDGSDSEKVMDDSDDEEDDSEDEEEETPKQPEPSNKKRVTASASKAQVSAKKIKPAVAATPQKTEEKKKSGHTATPHPAKKGGNNPNQSPKSGGQSSGGNKKQSNSGKQFGSNNKGKGKGRA